MRTKSKKNTNPRMQKATNKSRLVALQTYSTSPSLRANSGHNNTSLSLRSAMNGTHAPLSLRGALRRNHSILSLRGALRRGNLVGLALILLFSLLLLPSSSLSPLSAQQKLQKSPGGYHGELDFPISWKRYYTVEEKNKIMHDLQAK